MSVRPNAPGNLEHRRVHHGVGGSGGRDGGGTLLLLWLAWSRFGLATSDTALSTFSFLMLLYFGMFSIVSARERRVFWTTMPSHTLTASLLGEMLLGTLVTRLGFLGCCPCHGRRLGNLRLRDGVVSGGKRRREGRAHQMARARCGGLKQVRPRLLSRDSRRPVRSSLETAQRPASALPLACRPREGQREWTAYEEAEGSSDGVAGADDGTRRNSQTSQSLALIEGLAARATYGDRNRPALARQRGHGTGSR